MDDDDHNNENNNQESTDLAVACTSLNEYQYFSNSSKQFSFYICGPNWERKLQSTDGKSMVVFNNELSIDQCVSNCKRVGYSIKDGKEFHDRHYEELHRAGHKKVFEIDYKKNKSVIFINSMMHQDLCLECDGEGTNIQCQECWGGAHKHHYNLQDENEDEWICPRCKDTEAEDDDKKSKKSKKSKNNHDNHDNDDDDDDEEEDGDESDSGIYTNI